MEGEGNKGEGSRGEVTVEGESRGEVTMEGENREEVTMDGESRGEVTMEGESRGEVTMEGENRGEVTMEGESRGEVTMEGESRGEVTMEGESRGEVTMEGESRGEVTMEGESRGEVTMEGESRGDVTMEGESRGEVTMEGESRREVTMEGESRGEVTMEGESRGEVTMEMKEDGGSSPASEWEDILGNGQLMKKVVQKGKGISTRPAPQSRVKVRTCGYLESGKVVDKHSQCAFTVGEGDVIQAWDMVVTLMELGEIAKVKTVSRFAYGDNGKTPSIPGGATITYILELLEVLEPVQYDSITEEELVQLVNKKKTRGNKLFQQNEFQSASNSYQKGLEAIQKFLDEHQTEKGVPSNLLELQIRCLNNIAAAQLKLKQYQESLSACEKVLERDSTNVKALYRAGRVLAQLGEMNEAVTKLKKAMALCPNDKIILAELQKTLKKKEAQSKTEKAMYQRMMSGSVPTASKKSATPNNISWGPWPYMAIAGVTAVIAFGMAYILTQRQNN